MNQRVILTPVTTTGIDVSARVGTVLTAMVTPFGPDGSLDLAGAKKVAKYLVDSGCDGLVVSGTTGESPTVDHDEHCLLIKTTIEHAAGRIPVIAGTGANSTS